MDIYDKYIRSILDYPIKGINFRDITPLLYNGEAFHQAINDLVTLFPTYEEFDKIVAAESRGFLFGAPIAYSLSKGLVIARKPNKLPLVGLRFSYKLEYGEATLEIPEGSIQKGDRVILLDDLLATGGSCNAMKEMCEKLGAKVLECICLVDLRDLEGYKKVGVPCRSVCEYGLRENDLIQIEKSDRPEAFVTYKKEVSGKLLCITNEGKEVAISKNAVLNIIEIDENGVRRYIKYRP